MQFYLLGVCVCVCHRFSAQRWIVAAQQYTRDALVDENGKIGFLWNVNGADETINRPITVLLL